MAAQMVARAIFMSRQRDGLWGGVLTSAGEESGLTSGLVGDDGDDQWR